MRTEPATEVDDDDDAPDPDDDDVESADVVTTAPNSGLPLGIIILLDSAATHAVTPNIGELVDVVDSPIKTITGVRGSKRVRIQQGTMVF